MTVAAVVERAGTWWHRRAARERAAILHVVSLVAALVFLVWVDRHQWFAGDEWDFLVRRGVTGSHELGLFQPHNEHWSTLPILLYRGLFVVFGVRTYLPYLLTLFAFHLLVTHLLWRLMVRVSAAPMAATAAAAVFAVLGAGWEDLINTFQLTFFASVAFGLLALLTMPSGRFGRRDGIGWACNVAALMFSGIGVTMVIVTGFTALLRRGWRTALAVVSTPTIVYLAWYAKWGHLARSVDQEPLRTSLQQAPAFVWRGLVDTVDGITGLAGSAPVVLALLAIWLVRATYASIRWPAVVATALGAPVFLFLVNLRRSGLGVAAAGAPRYGYVIAALLFPAGLLAASSLIARNRFRTWITLAVTGTMMLVGVSTLNHEANVYADIKQENKHRILAAAELLRRGEPTVSDVPAPEFNPDLRSQQLLALAHAGDLPGNVRLTAADRLSAAEYLQLSVEIPIDDAPTGVVVLIRTEGARVTAGASPDCVRVVGTSDHPTVVLGLDQPGSVRITPQRTGSVTAQLQRRAPNSLTRGRGRAWTFAGGSEHILSVAATGPRLRLGVPPDGSTELCNVAIK